MDVTEWEGEGRSAVPAPLPAASTLESEVRNELAGFADLDLHELRVRWRRLFRSTAPAHLSRYLLLRVLAYRIQANAFGDLDRETVRLLDRIAKQRAAGDKNPVPPVAEARTLKPGSQLVREHEGTLHRVTVLERGYDWNGTRYNSLSEVARAITGTQCNGPRFFGLRDKPVRGRRGGAA